MGRFSPWRDLYAKCVGRGRLGPLAGPSGGTRERRGGEPSDDSLRQAADLGRALAQAGVAVTEVMAGPWSLLEQRLRQGGGPADAALRPLDRLVRRFMEEYAAATQEAAARSEGATAGQRGALPGDRGRADGPDLSLPTGWHADFRERSLLPSSWAAAGGPSRAEFPDVDFGTAACGSSTTPGGLYARAQCPGERAPGRASRWLGGLAAVDQPRVFRRRRAARRVPVGGA